MLTENDIARITRRIVEAHAPLAVGTFGSYAVGTASQDSDLDLFVVRDSYERPVRRARAVKRLLFGVLHPLDVHVFTPEEFEETAYEVLSFTWVIARQARLYHWAESAAKRLPSLLPRAACRAQITDSPSSAQLPLSTQGVRHTQLQATLPSLENSDG